MKKKLVASLAAAMVLGVAGTSFAASNPFVDVPAKHWSYDAVTKLSQAGIVDGMGDGRFVGDKVVTRYEMAQIVAKAMAKEDKADAAQKAMIDKLAAEYKEELAGLNVRVSDIEKKIDGLGTVKWGGEVRARYDNVKETGYSRTTSPSQTYVDLWATAKINNDWVAKVEIESSKTATNSTAGKAGIDNGEPNTTRIFAQGPLFGTKATVGKFNPFVGYGLVIDDNMTGGQFEFGNVLKARIGYGKYAGGISNTSVLNNSASIGSFSVSPTYAFGELDYATSKDTNIKFAYHNLTKIVAGDLASNQTSVHYTELGFDTKLAADWAFMATYAKSNIDIANQDNKGYLTQITYKAADVKKEGSFDIYANYRKIPVAAQLDSTWDYSRGIKGTQIGFDYVPATNIKVNAFYLAGKTMVDKDNSVDAKVYRAQVEFFF